MRSFPRSSWCVLAFLLACTACSEIGEAPPPPVPAPSLVAPPLAEQGGKRSVRITSGRRMARTPPAAAEPKKADQPPAQPAPEIDPEELVGRSDSDIVKVLGRPTSEEDASPAKVMTFAAADCSLVIHFFPDMVGGGFRALDVRTDGSLAPGICVARIQAGDRKAQLVPAVTEQTGG